MLIISLPPPLFLPPIEQGDQQNPAPAGPVDYTKAWEEYYKKMGMFYISFLLHLIKLKHLVNITLEG